MITIGYSIAFILICIASYTDVKTFQIPNRLSILPYFFGSTLYLIQVDFVGLGWATLSGVIVFIILLLLYFAKGLGAGDVKFISGLPFLIESNSVWILLLYSFLLAGLIALVIFSFRYMMILVKYLLHGYGKYTHIKSAFFEKSNLMLEHTIDKTSKLKQIPFMMAVLPAFILFVCFEVVV